MSASLGTGTRGLVRALAPHLEPASTERGRIRQLVEHVTEPGTREIWLLFAVLSRTLPTGPEVDTALRLVRHSGLEHFIRELGVIRRKPAQWFVPAIEIISEPVLLDVHDSASSRLMTGVQRVARSIALEWIERPGVILVGWSTRGTQLLRIHTDAFVTRARRGLFARRPIVPWGGHFVLAELVTEPERSVRTQAIAGYAGVRSAFVANDAIPLTTAETTGAGMPGVFAKYLAAASRFDVAACISKAAAVEYTGWREMLGSAGITGPQISVVPLPLAAGDAPAEAEAQAREFLLTGDLPMVLVVGSHEPRKNHQAVLHAAEVLWREGHEFSLVFIGGNAWNSAEFALRLDELQKAGRPVASHSGIAEPILWWAYRLAAFSVFPSLNEGFGLPVAESLASGVPAVTSDFGSMREIAAAGGCVLVDPRSDASIAEGMRVLLTDGELRSSLATQATARIEPGWGRYASELWNLVLD